MSGFIYEGGKVKNKNHMYSKHESIGGKGEERERLEVLVSEYVEGWELLEK